MDDAAIVPTESDPLRLLEVTANATTSLNPILGHFAKVCIAVAREKRLEIEARLTARLQELAASFMSLDRRHASEVADRQLQFQALSVLLDLAKGSGDPRLITEAMQCFKQYVQSAPTFTRDFADALTKVNSAVDLFPAAERDE